MANVTSHSHFFLSISTENLQAYRRHHSMRLWGLTGLPLVFLRFSRQNPIFTSTGAAVKYKEDPQDHQQQGNDTMTVIMILLLLLLLLLMLMMGRRIQSEISSQGAT